MTESRFDPFALPSSFDPLAAPLPPPPRKRRRAAGEPALEDEVAILKARLDGLEKAIETRFDGQMGRIMLKVAEMLEAERLALVGAVLPERRRR